MYTVLIRINSEDKPDMRLDAKRDTHILEDLLLACTQDGLYQFTFPLVMFESLFRKSVPTVGMALIIKQNKKC